MSTKELEQRLINLFGYGHAVLLGRARSGLLALGEVLDLKGMDTVIPSNLCPTVPAAFCDSGLSVRLAQVNAKSGLAEDESLINAMSCSHLPGIVMPTHIYGHWRPYTQAQEWARRNKWFVLENDTLCAARVRMGRRQAFGDALLVSFGYAKSINAGGGGALLTDDYELAKNLRSLVSNWPELDSFAIETDNNLMLARRHLRLLGRADLGERLMELDQAQLRHSFPLWIMPNVLAEIDMLESRLTKRAEVADCWNQMLEPVAHILNPVSANVTAPWRLIRTVTAPFLRDRIVSSLRAEGFDVGTNFPALTESYPLMLGSQVSSEANAWSDSSLNLWLEEIYTPKRINLAVACINRSIETYS